MCKLCWGVSALFAVVIATMSYVFVIRGNVVDSPDGRTAIILTAGERNEILAEMRGFLESVQEITSGLAENDMEAIAISAHRVGMVNAQNVPVALMAKLPLEFKTLGMATHKAFDEIAMESKDMKDSTVVMSKLGALLNNCTTCHAGYRLDAEAAPKS